MDDYQSSSRFAKRIVFRVLVFIMLAVILGFAVLFLWNFVLAQVTNFAVINYWQALGLLILFRILFGGFHFGWIKMLKNRGDHGEQHFLKDKLMSMDEGDRAAFKEEWRKRCENRKRQ